MLLIFIALHLLLGLSAQHVSYDSHVRSVPLIVAQGLYQLEHTRASALALHAHPIRSGYCAAQRLQP